MGLRFLCELYFREVVRNGRRKRSSPVLGVRRDYGDAAIDSVEFCLFTVSLRGGFAHVLADRYANAVSARSPLRHLESADPFMGGGTTIVEGSRLGMRMFGCDLNPVAWFVVKNELAQVDIEDVKRLAGERPHQRRGKTTDRASSLWLGGCLLIC